jgi:RNA-directed DNA polymerase
MESVKYRQLALVFADSPKGGGQEEVSGVPEGKSWLLRTAKAKAPDHLTARKTDASRLLEQAASPSNMAKALLNVARNKGAAGVDGCGVDEVVENARTLLPQLREALMAEEYRPGDIRRVWIPKPGGGQRGLGIPNVVDRWVQQAVFQVLEPICEPLFDDGSHGFRPGRGAHTAIREAAGYVEEGYGTVVDIDISKFFDCVNHQRLLNRLARQVDDGRVLKLVHRMLKAKVAMPDGTVVATEEGTPQGGPLSPLLSNVVLDELDKELRRRGLRFVRYADDCNIFVRSERAGRRVMKSIRRFIERRLRLRINEKKSSVTRPEETHFLGFRVELDEDGTARIRLSQRSVDRMKARIRELTPRTWGKSLQDCMDEISKFIRGWEAYFGICLDRILFRNFDAHIRRRLRAIAIKQKKRPRFLYRFMVSRKVRPSIASESAYRPRGIWPRSIAKGINMALPNKWFFKRMSSLLKLWEGRQPKTANPGVRVQLLLPFAQ